MHKQSVTVIASLRTSQCGEALTNLKWTKAKPVPLGVHGVHQVSFDPCFVELGGLEGLFFSIVLLETTGMVLILIRLLHLGPLSGRLSLSHHSVE